MNIKSGSTNILEVGPILDYKGMVVDNLPSATAIEFVISKSADATADNVMLEKTLEDGIEIDTERDGYLFITTSSDESYLLTSKRYYMALKIFWVDNEQEIDLQENSRIIETVDIRRGIIPETA